MLKSDLIRNLNKNLGVKLALYRGNIRIVHGIVTHNHRNECVSARDQPTRSCFADIYQGKRLLNRYFIEISQHSAQLARCNIRPLNGETSLIPALESGVATALPRRSSLWHRTLRAATAAQHQTKPKQAGAQQRQ